MTLSSLSGVATASAIMCMSDRQRFVEEVRRAEELTDLDPDAAIDSSSVPCSAGAAIHGSAWSGPMESQLIERISSSGARRRWRSERRACSRSAAWTRYSRTCVRWSMRIRSTSWLDINSRAPSQRPARGRRPSARFNAARRLLSKRGLVLDAALMASSNGC